MRDAGLPGDMRIGAWTLVILALGGCVSRPLRSSDRGDGSGVVAGAGGSTGTGGSTGAGGAIRAGGGAGGSPCEALLALDRSCASDSDCAVVVHETNCCGGYAWVGVRASLQEQFAILEAQCEDFYPDCGCADWRRSTDDGSRVTSATMVAAACEAGVCRTYLSACGHLCASGSSCQTCTDVATVVVTASCAPQCSSDADCPDPDAARCNLGHSTGLCSRAEMSCERPN
jgi:hypothetical protein